MTYPTFRELITREIDTLKQTLQPPKRRRRIGRRPSINFGRLARELKVGVTTLTKWRAGATFPSHDQIEQIVQRLRSDVREQDRLREEIEASREADVGEAEIEVAPLDYWPFSGRSERNLAEQKEGFLDAIVRGAFGQSRRRVRFTEPRTGARDAEQSARRPNRINICMFDTLERGEELQTLHSPLRVTINAVTLVDEGSDPEAQRERVEDLLLGKTNDFERYFPVALNPEVGYSYLKDTLRFRGLEATDSLASSEPPLDLSAARFADKLIEAHGRVERPVAFLLVDELTALRVVVELARRRHESRGRIRWSPCLVLPLSTHASLQMESKRTLPVFAIGLATVRSGSRLAEFVRRRLASMLEQTELISRNYYDLYLSLRAEIEKCLDDIQVSDEACHARILELQQEPVGSASLWNDGCATQVALYMARLSPREPLDALGNLNLRWRQIVERVRAMLPQPREGSESVREARFRIAFLPLEPVVVPRSHDIQRPDLTRRTLNLSALGFVGLVMRPFQHLADPMQLARSEEEFRVATFNDGPEDVRVGRLETYDRLRFWKYYRVPFFVPLNAVILSSDLASAHDGNGAPLELSVLRAAVSPFRFEADEALKVIRRQLRFVVLDAGAGADLFLEKEEGFRPAERDVVRRRGPEPYVEALTQGPLGGGRIRILVVHVLACLKVLELLRKRGIEGQLLFDVGNLEVRTDKKADRRTQTLLMPEYNAGIAVNRQSRMWIEFFDDAYPRRLREDRSELIDLVDRLRTDVIAYLGPLLGNDSERTAIVADHLVCLDDYGCGRLPEWEPILEAVRARRARSAQSVLP